MSKNFEVLERHVRERSGTDTGTEMGTATDPTALAPAGLRASRWPKGGAVPPRFRVPEDVAEEYLKLKTNLVMIKSAAPLQLLGVVGSKHGDGATSVATNLALAFATDGTHRVLVVDASFHRPSIHRVFRFPREPGFTDLLAGAGSFEDFIHDTPVPQLAAITVGRAAGNPARLLETERCSQFLAFARERYDVTIFDTSPFLPYSDARVMATRVDGSLVVVQANHTRLADVARTKHQLQAIGARVLGAVLNRQKHFIPEFMHEWV